jgi:perosamine synthetase
MIDMVYPRQRLYDVNHAGFAKAILSGSLNDAGADGDDAAVEAGLRRAFFDYTGIDDLVPLSRGRLAGYFGVKHSITPLRRKVIMSPFTIFDLVNMVRVAGGAPEFIDTESGGVHVSCRALEQAIDEDTAAVIVTHYHSTNREIQEISQLCRARGVKLIEDCAISLGARVDGAHVGSFGDFALFSFGLFKFVSTYFGGGLAVRSPETRGAIEAELADWPRMTSRDLAPYAIKGLKLSILTSRILFDHFTFPLFRFGYLRNVGFIKKSAQNDPEPFRRDVLPSGFQRRPSLFQLREFARQIPLVEEARRLRLENAARYYSNFSKTNVGGLPERPDPDTDCYLNFPILLNGDRERFVREMMKSGFDLSVYYYRNCAKDEAFSQFGGDFPNISKFVENMVFFPTYPGIDHDYIDGLTRKASDLLTYKLSNDPPEPLAELTASEVGLGGH